MITLLWPSLALHNRASLPPLPGVYVCRPWFGLGRARYVGMSMNLRQRWSGPTPHHRLAQMPGHTRIQFYAFPGATLAELRGIEALLIARLRPRLNYTPIRRRWLRRAWRWLLTH